MRGLSSVAKASTARSRDVDELPIRPTVANTGGVVKLNVASRWGEKERLFKASNLLQLQDVNVF